MHVESFNDGGVIRLRMGNDEGETFERFTDVPIVGFDASECVDLLSSNVDRRIGDGKERSASSRLSESDLDVIDNELLVALRCSATDVNKTSRCVRKTCLWLLTDLRVSTAE